MTMRDFGAGFKRAAMANTASLNASGIRGQYLPELAPGITQKETDEVCSAARGCYPFG